MYSLIQNLSLSQIGRQHPNDGSNTSTVRLLAFAQRMEVVGVIAAVPPLLKMMSQIGTALHQLSSKTRTSKAVQGLRSQLDLLAPILSSIDGQYNAWSSLGRHPQNRLRPVIRDLEEELTGLATMVDKVEGPNGSGPSTLRRIKLVLTRFENDLKERGQRLDRAITLLQICLAELTNQANQRRQIRHFLAPLATDFIPKKLDGTIEWIWDHEKFKQWIGQTPHPVLSRAPTASNDQNRVLIVHGVKGCGKSVLAASVVDELRIKGSFALFFSFWAGHGRERTCDAMLRALLWQLLEVLPLETQFRIIPRLLDSLGHLTQTHFIAGRIADVGQEFSSEIFCVIDGIDESTDDWNSLDKNGPVSCLTDLLQAIPTMHLLLIGRQSSLRSAIRKWPSRIELTRDLALDDLNKFISAELDSCPNITDVETRQIILKELDAKSTVMFLWIKLVIKELRSSFSLQEVGYTLSRIPEELDREYGRIFLMLMDRLHGRTNNPSAGMIRARGLLELLVGASRPLSVTELRHAHAFASVPDACNTGYMNNLVSEEGIIHACGDFITIKDNIVSLGHTSMREFVLRSADHWTGQDRDIDFFRLDLKNCHRVMGLSCLKYLKHIDWEHGKSDSAQWESGLANRYPLLYYASNFTTAHLLNSDLSPEEASFHARGFIELGKFEMWMEFVAFAAEESSSFVSPPPQFWEEMLQFWGTPHLSESGTNNHASLLSLIIPRPLLEFLDAGLDSEVAASTAGEGGSKSSSLGKTGQPRLQDKTVATAASGTVAAEASLQEALQEIMANHSDTWTGQLLRTLPGVSTLIRAAGLLMDPLDVLFQALERSMNSASFFNLMAFGHIALQYDRKELALKTFRKALSRVEGKNDLREAWALGTMADYGDDIEVIQAQYARVFDLLEPRRDNPAVELARASVSCGRAVCLFKLKRDDEAKIAAAEAERILSTPLGVSVPSTPTSVLRQWCYRQIAASGVFSERRFKLTVLVGDMYRVEGFDEDAKRIVNSFVRDMPAGERSRHQWAQLMLVYFDVKYFRRQDDNSALKLAADIRPFFKPENDEERLDFFSLQLRTAILHFRLAELEQAYKELASLDISFFIQNIGVISKDPWYFRNFIVYFLDIHFAVGKLKEAVGKLDAHWPFIEKAFVKKRMPCNGHLTGPLHTMLKHGLFQMSERYLRQMLRQERLGKSSSVEEIVLREALAFSVFHRFEAHRRLESYELYKACSELAETKMPDWRSHRLMLGLGLAAASVGKPDEASSHFSTLASKMHSCYETSWFSVMLSRIFKAMADLYGGRPSEALLSLPPEWTDDSSSEEGSISDDSSASDDVSEETEDLVWWDTKTEHDTLILSVVAHMLSAHIFITTDRASEGRRLQDKCLEMLEDGFPRAFNTIAAPQGELLDGWIIHWARASHGYLSQRGERTDAATGLLVPLFPLQLFFPTGYSLYDPFRWPYVLN
ncbi:hypothetical protein B0I35DRAFT_183127 [Stachybotrys elegans]|uniref:Nephrocystin 3-like N-terminal domain-containing protein n=1 Tax=Stachybotrys elegans TaxID=80388 RepID=A0A8K0SV47_9HYPO|nr:hypothetical protein B0I35DRAFT_183127 [Stachybotrys elegans]